MCCNSLVDENHREQSIGTCCMISQLSSTFKLIEICQLNASIFMHLKIFPPDILTLKKKK